MTFPSPARCTVALGAALVLFGCPSSNNPDGGSGADASLPDSGNLPGSDAGADAGPPDSGTGLVDGGPPCADGGFDCCPVGTDGGCGLVGPPQMGAPGWPCTQDDECLPTGFGICLSIHRCSAPCTSLADCPVSWSCGGTGGGSDAGTSQTICQCTPTSAVEICNGIDDDCSGEVDEGTDLCPTPETCTAGSCTCASPDVCGDACVDPQTDPDNCGGCGNVCPAGDTCVTGSCFCPTGSLCGDVDAGTAACVNIGSDPSNCGHCGDACLATQDCYNSACGPPNLEWARWSLLSTPTLTSTMTATVTADGGTTNIPTVTDSVTGLVWQQTPQMSGPGTVASMTWPQAQQYCASLGPHWRVPTLIELLSIVSYTTPGNPAVNTAAFPNFPDFDFWTSSPGVSDAGSPDSGMAWAVEFPWGNDQPYVMIDPLYVLCVQSGD